MGYFNFFFEKTINVISFSNRAVQRSLVRALPIASRLPQRNFGGNGDIYPIHPHFVFDINARRPKKLIGMIMVGYVMTPIILSLIMYNFSMARFRKSQGQ